jgi:hypothetical protein
MSFEVVKEFEEKIAEFFGAPFAVAVDSCTHGIELCLRHEKPMLIDVPKRTYVSIPMLSEKLGIGRVWSDAPWTDYYYLTHNIIDAAVLWRKDSYIPCTLMVVSFQFRKHLSLGRGGMILLDDEEVAHKLKLMSYDGREPGTPWREQNIKTIGYHYYMTPETAKLGLGSLDGAINKDPDQWLYTDWPDLTQMEVFNA